MTKVEEGTVKIAIIQKNWWKFAIIKKFKSRFPEPYSEMDLIKSIAE